MPSKKRQTMIAALRRDFPLPVLIIVMGIVLRQRAGLVDDNAPLAIKEPEKELDAFLQSATVRQLQIIREGAKTIGPPKEVTDPTELAMLASIEKTKH